MTESPRLVPRRRPNANAVLDGDTTDEGDVTLNATAYAIWELCDGSTAVDEMVDAAASLFDAPVETIAADVDRILTQLTDLELLAWQEP